jgi:hypothetical protein
MGRKLFLPSLRDISSVLSNSVLYVQPKAIQLGTTKRQKSHFALGINFFLFMLVNYKSEYVGINICMIYLS